MMKRGETPGGRSDKAVLEASKQRWREQVWRALEDSKVALFPSDHTVNFEPSANATHILIAKMALAQIGLKRSLELFSVLDQQPDAARARLRSIDPDMHH